MMATTGNRTTLVVPPNQARHCDMADTDSTNPITSYCAWMAMRNLSPNTIKRRQSSLGALARFVAPTPLTSATLRDVEEWISTHSDHPSTAHAYRSDARNFFAWAVRRNLATTDPTLDVDPIRVPKSLPRPVPIQAVPNLIALAPTAELRLVLLLAAYAGLRRSEIANLTTDDYQLFGDAMLIVRAGKGGKDRVVPLHPAIVAELAKRRPVGKVIPLTSATIGRQASRHLRAHGYDCTLHQLRHSFGTEMARVFDGNLVAVGRAMGHSDPATTMGYVGWSGGDTGRVAGLYNVA